jgi:hypothetical protein
MTDKLDQVFQNALTTIEKDSTDIEDIPNLIQFLLPNNILTIDSFGIQYKNILFESWVKQPSSCCGAAVVAGVLNSLLKLKRGYNSFTHTEILKAYSHLFLIKLKNQLQSFQNQTTFNILDILPDLLTEYKKELNNKNIQLSTLLSKISSNTFLYSNLTINKKNIIDSLQIFLNNSNNNNDNSNTSTNHANNNNNDDIATLKSNNIIFVPSSSSSSNKISKKLEKRLNISNKNNILLHVDIKTDLQNDMSNMNSTDTISKVYDINKHKNDSFNQTLNISSTMTNNEYIINNNNNNTTITNINKLFHSIIKTIKGYNKLVHPTLASTAAIGKYTCIIHVYLF